MRGLLVLGFTALLMAAALRTAAAEPLPFSSDDEAEEFLEEHEREIRAKLKLYNKQQKIVRPNSGRWTIIGFGWTFDRIEDESLFVVINFYVGTDWNPQRETALFELVWREGGVEFASHQTDFKVRKKNVGARVLPTVGKNECVYNYFAQKPCPHTKRRWEEFSELVDLPVDETSAVAFQAYMQNDTALGDRLVAVAQGLPDPGGSSVFELQGEIQRLNPGQFQRGSKEPCDLNPNGAKPCPEIIDMFKAFAERHGLDPDRRSARMFEAYARGDYKKADVLYAVAKDLPVPSYGYIATGIARDVAGLDLAQYQHNISEPCDLNPYGPKPCLEIVHVWRQFAERYGLEDNQANARIFATYGEGEMRTADQLFAQAKGISLEQLLEASGLPASGLVIEVYPTPKPANRQS